MQEITNRLKEQLEGCQQLLALDQAVLAAVLSVSGPVTVDRRDINRHLQAQTAVRAVFDETAGTYRLSVREAETRDSE